MTFTYEYPRPAVSVDLVVIRELDQQRQLLLIQRKYEPFADSWALPGGFLDPGETLEQAAARELLEETRLRATQLKQLKAYSAVDRDPRTRVISVAFLAQVPSDQTPSAEDDAQDVGWFDLKNLPPLAFDHQQIVTDGISAMGR